MGKVTITEVAKRAGVSIKTVSRVVNREPNVRPATREKVEKIITELDYRPNQSARDLASRWAHLITLVYDDPSTYDLPSAGYIIRLQEGMLRACRSSGFEVLIHPCAIRKRGVADELTALIRQARPAGIVLMAPISNTPRIVNAIRATGTPLVRVSPGIRNGKTFTVCTNDREFSADMTRYLASLGHRRIAFVTGHPSHKAVGLRFLGYQDGLEESGIAFDGRLVVAGDNSFGSGAAAAHKLLGRKNPPTAIFAANDDMAVGVVREAARLGIEVPAQLSVAGCDDITLAEQIFPTLTTIRQPLAEMAEVAAMAIIEHARSGRPLTGTRVIEGSLQIRESTAPPPGAAD